MTLHRNLVAGEWREASDVAADINPSDVSDVVGEYTQADAKMVREAVAAAKSAAPGLMKGRRSVGCAARRWRRPKPLTLNPGILIDFRP